MKKGLHPAYSIDAGDEVTIQVFTVNRDWDIVEVAERLRKLYEEDEHLSSLSGLHELYKAVGLNCLAAQTLEQIGGVKEALRDAEGITLDALGYLPVPDGLIELCWSYRSLSEHNDAVPVALIEEVWLKAEELRSFGLFCNFFVWIRKSPLPSEFFLIGNSGEKNYLLARWGRGLDSMLVL